MPEQTEVGDAAHRAGRGRGVRDDRRDLVDAAAAARARADPGRRRTTAVAVTTSCSLATEFAASPSQPASTTRCCSASTSAAPSCAVGAALRVPRPGRRRRPDAAAAGLGGVGRDRAGSRCEVERDGTGGLNRPGDVVVHVPREPHGVGDRRASARAGCAAASSTARRASRSTAPSPDHHGGRRRSPSAAPSRPCTPRPSPTRSLGLSEGVPGQVFRLERAARSSPTASRSWSRSATGAGWERGREVDSFAGCDDEDDTVFRVDRATGDIRLRPGGARARRDAAPLRRRAAQGRAAAGARATASAAAAAATWRRGTI